MNWHEQGGENYITCITSERFDGDRKEVPKIYGESVTLSFVRYILIPLKHANLS